VPTDKQLAAKKLLETPLIQEAFELIEQNLLLDFKHLKPSDMDGLKLTKLQLHALDSLKRYLIALAQAATIEENKYEHIP